MATAKVKIDIGCSLSRFVFDLFFRDRWEAAVDRAWFNWYRCEDPARRELLRIAHRLEPYFDPPEIETWIYSPHHILEGQVPADLIKAGKAATVHELVDQLEALNYV